MLSRDLRDRVAVRRDASRLAAQSERLSGATSTHEVLTIVNEVLPGGVSQDPAEITSFIESVAPRTPRVVVEIGTEAGGTTLTLARALPSVELVIGVDLFVQHAGRIRRLVRTDGVYEAVYGNSVAPRTVETVRSILAGRSIDVLFIDGDHTFAGALADFRTYSPFVRRDGVIAFHDIVPDATLRTGQSTWAYVGEVPLLWRCLRPWYQCVEFVSSWDQEGRGIGSLTFDPDVVPDLSASW
jgi:predicted O-methyltransferase YrrM